MKAADKLGNRRDTGSVQRINISLPEGIFRELDQMVAERGLENRSKAIAEMLSRFVLERRRAAVPKGSDQLLARPTRRQSSYAGSRPHSQGDHRKDPFVQRRTLLQADPYRYHYSSSVLGAGSDGGILLTVLMETPS
jgi:hypothetical protein